MPGEVVTNPWFCPKCGSRLVLKKGTYGHSMACPGYPKCRYTRAYWTFQGVKPFCDKCNNTGKIPFIKEGRVIPHAIIYCECHEDEPDHYYPIDPGDFDFPISYSYYRSLCQQYGWHDPGPTDLPETEPPPIYQNMEWSPGQWAAVQQLKSLVQHLQNKLVELSKAKKDGF